MAQHNSGERDMLNDRETKIKIGASIISQNSNIRLLSPNAMHPFSGAPNETLVSGMITIYYQSKKLVLGPLTVFENFVSVRKLSETFKYIVHRVTRSNIEQSRLTSGLELRVIGVDRD